MPKIKVLVDTDTILELFLNRKSFVEEVEKLLQETAQTEGVEVYITDKCLRRVCSELGDTNSELGEESAAYIKAIFNERIIAINLDLKEQARGLPLQDFDSAEELACATRLDLDAIVTQNPSNFNGTNFPIWSISGLLERQILNKILNKIVTFDYRDSLFHLLKEEMQSQVKDSSALSVQDVVKRIAKEVERICDKSSRIQNSGAIQSWQITLGRYRLQKCLCYYQLGSKRGKVELHSQLGAMVYRHVTVAGSELGFAARYNLIEDFLQDFYIEVIKAFRRENELPEDYTPRNELQLAEYMAFIEQYAKRLIILPGAANQQLIVSRAQGFARRQPQETTVDSAN